MIEYTVTINSLSTGERLWTIKYAEWGPNNGDRDLAMQYERSMDNRYIYSGHDGKIYGFEGDVAGMFEMPHPGGCFLTSPIIDSLYIRP